jgi:two-component system cell cycle sensor histidine kinase/response regulator CckA
MEEILLEEILPRRADRRRAIWKGLTGLFLLMWLSLALVATGTPQSGPATGALDADRGTTFAERHPLIVAINFATLATLSLTVVLLLVSISKRRRAERALQRSESTLRQVLDLVPHMIFARDAEGSFLILNKAAAEVFNTTVEELTGEFRADGRGISYEIIGVLQDDAVVLETGQAMLIPEQSYLDHAGATRWLQIHKVPYVDEETRQRAVLGIAIDITVLKEAEEERLQLDNKVRQAQKLESLGVLAGGIAHDFNNLLAAILANADLAIMELDDEAAGGEPAESRQFMEAVVQSSVRAADLCSQMLAYSGRGKFVVQRINLNALIAEMMQLLEVSISKKIVLRCDFADPLPGVDGDATQLRQIVMNLITNASDSIGDTNGVITVRTGAMECSEADLGATLHAEDVNPGSYVFYEVSDDGCGMDSETMDRIFDPFFTTKFTGRGLGMAAVLGIVRAHHGAIRIDSEKTQGATLRVLLPAVEPLSEEPAAPAAPSEPLGACAGTLLVADDEEPVRWVAGQALERAGFKVILAADGREAVDLFREHHGTIDAVLLDMTMPRLSGAEAYREIRTVSADVPVVLSSGFTESETLREFVVEGLAGFLKKPYRARDLVAMFRGVAER